MVRVFIDLPNPTINCHFDTSCRYYGRPEQPGHRFVRIRPPTISKELENFANNVHRFAAQRELNSMWLEVAFHDEEFELAVVRHIQRLLIEHHAPFGTVDITVHCGR